jgi:hypothetical protein
VVAAGCPAPARLRFKKNPVLAGCRHRVFTRSSTATLDARAGCAKRQRGRFFPRNCGACGMLAPQLQRSFDPRRGEGFKAEGKTKACLLCQRVCSVRNPVGPKSKQSQRRSAQAFPDPLALSKYEIESTALRYVSLLQNPTPSWSSPAQALPVPIPFRHAHFSLCELLPTGLRQQPGRLARLK